MWAYRIIKLLFVLLLCALIALANYLPDQITITGLWWVPGFVFSWGIPLPLLTALNLFGLLLSAALPIVFIGFFDDDWNPHASTAAVYLLNPLAIFIWFSQETLWLSLYLFLPRVLLVLYILFRVIFGKREVDAGGEQVKVVWWKPMLAIIGLLSFGLFLAASWTSFTTLTTNHFYVEPLLAGRFAEVWLSYWNSTVLYILIAILLVLFVMRVLVRFSRITTSTLLGSVLGMGVVFLSIIVALPALQANLISPDRRVKDVSGLTGLVARLASLNLHEGENVLFIQNDLQYNNIYIKPVNNIFPLIDHLLWGRVIASGAHDANLAYEELNNQIYAGNVTLPLLSSFGVHYVAVVEPQEKTVYSKNLDNLFALARSESNFPELQVTGEVTRRAFLFENRTYNGEKVTVPNSLTLRWAQQLSGNTLTQRAQAEVQTKVALPASAHFGISATAQQGWRLQLIPTAGSATINEQPIRLSSAAQLITEFTSTRKVFYVIANEQPFGEVSSTSTLPFDQELLRSVRLYGRYDSTNILDLADFTGITSCGGATPSFSLGSSKLSITSTGDACLVLSTPSVEARSSVLLDLQLQAKARNATVSACIYDLSENACIMNVDGSNSQAKEFDPLFRHTLQVRIYLRRAGLGSEISADITQVRLREYELAKQATTNIVAPKSSLVDVQRGDRIVVSRRVKELLDLDLEAFSSCDLSLKSQLQQSLELTGDGLQVNAAGSWCISAALPQSNIGREVTLLFANGQYWGWARVFYGKVYLTGSGNQTFQSLQLVVL